MLCVRCSGSGMYKGLGNMIVDCELCANEGSDKESKPALDRKSSSYKKAIADIMKLDKSMSRDDAVRIFESEYCKD